MHFWSLASLAVASILGISAIPFVNSVKVGDKVSFFFGTRIEVAGGGADMVMEPRPLLHPTFRDDKKHIITSLELRVCIPQLAHMSQRSPPAER